MLNFILKLTPSALTHLELPQFIQIVNRISYCASNQRNLEN